LIFDALSRKNLTNVRFLTSKTEPKNWQAVGLSDQTEEASSSFSGLWILLGIAGLTALYLLFVRKQAEQE